MADKVITDAGVIEQIRNAMPAATIDKKGLANKGLNKYEFTLNTGEERVFEYPYSLVLLTTSQLGHSIVFLFSNNLTEIKQNVSNAFVFEDTDGRLCILRASETKFKIINRRDESIRLNIAFL